MAVYYVALVLNVAGERSAMVRQKPAVPLETDHSRRCRIANVPHGQCLLGLTVYVTPALLLLLLLLILECVFFRTLEAAKNRHFAVNCRSPRAYAYDCNPVPCALSERNFK